MYIHVGVLITTLCGSGALVKGWNTTKFKRSRKGGFLYFKLSVVVSLGGHSPGTIHTRLIDKLYTD